jgi:hypothetical protein
MKYNLFKTNVLFIFAVVIFCSINSFAQKSTAVSDVPTTAIEDLRPFDFSDKYYASNGVMAGMLLNRPNGADDFSVMDLTGYPDHNNVRILATRPAYGRDGETLYWNLYGDFYKENFTDTPEGERAYDLANTFPIYLFPNTQRRRGERQSPVIDTAEGYFEKNVLGLSVVMLVEYNGSVFTKADAAYLSDLAKRNGLSTDGDPIIRTVKEIGQLQRRNLITVSQRGINNPSLTSYIAGKAIQHPNGGALTPDSFLLYVKDAYGKPLAGEAHFVSTFECLKNGNCF